MIVTQTRFRGALLDPTQAVPEGLLDGADQPAGRRFAVYRNNVVVSLTEALQVAFPLVYKLLGAQTFARLAGIYVRAHPPSSPLMMHYGAALPGFLETFEPLAHLGYLADCARLDLALRAAYHAADAPALAPERLQCAPEALVGMSLALHPATRIVRSRWPLYDIWRLNNEADAPKPRAVAQDVLITRPEFDPSPHLLPEGGALWLESLASGQTFGAAHDTALAAVPDFDLAQALTLALQTSALTDDKTKDD
ncbi:HvfC/BufC N-terminal domain-containing protein [Roseobacter sinensis]|uniref:DNA-binding domain-containing protein n=1 Tax=Roseobacter sinensis TaxID=2931391 RepID=A0ABT3BA53_9RHOB|nr:DNA-binding domain-containing protein [Roseobacter sp. WL0113]MCV3270437.1 DNA-binding domain-containing protein [Roseobacter sp. WL0113]